MNPAGQIVGHYEKDGPPFVLRGYLLSNGVFTPIEIGDFSDARGINIAGAIVGWFVSAVDGYVTHGYFLSKGNVTQIDYPSADYTIAEALNAGGDVVGYYGINGTEHGFLLHQGVLNTIDYPGATLTNARGINLQGDIVGLYTNDPNLNGPYHGFLRKNDGIFTTVNGPGVQGGNANGINTRGQIVGEYVDPAQAGVILGFLLVKGEYTTIRYPGASITRPWKITLDGQHIVGFYNDLHGFLLSRKP